MRHNWSLVQEYYEAGHSAASCRQRFGILYGVWSTAVYRGYIRLDPARARDERRRHNWSEVQEYYDRGHSFRKCMARFGFSPAAWHKAVKRGEIRPRPNGRPVAVLLATGGSRTHIKQRLLREGLLQNRCDECGLSEWMNERLSIQLDHINGNGSDYSRKNLRMLCPNCHSQTETYGRRPGRPGRLQDPPSLV